MGRHRRYVARFRPNSCRPGRRDFVYSGKHIEQHGIRSFVLDSEWMESSMAIWQRRCAYLPLASLLSRIVGQPSVMQRAHVLFRSASARERERLFRQAWLSSRGWCEGDWPAACHAQRAHMRQSTRLQAYWRGGRGVPALPHPRPSHAFGVEGRLARRPPLRHRREVFPRNSMQRARGLRRDGARPRGRAKGDTGTGAGRGGAGSMRE